MKHEPAAFNVYPVLHVEQFVALKHVAQLIWHWTQIPVYVVDDYHTVTKPKPTLHYEQLVVFVYIQLLGGIKRHWPVGFKKYPYWHALHTVAFKQLIQLVRPHWHKPVVAL